MEKCFRTLFGIPLGPGALPTLRPLMPMKLDLEGGLILSRTQLVCLLCRWLACVAGLTSRRVLLNDSR